jgi:hypothetical protein
VREHVCPALPLETGYTVIRGIADHDMGRGEAFETWGRGELVGGAALPAGRSYWFYEAPSDFIDGRDPLAAVGAERWPAPTPAQLGATPPERVLNPILADPPPAWTRGTRPSRTPLTRWSESRRRRQATRTPRAAALRGGGEPSARCPPSGGPALTRGMFQGSPRFVGGGLNRAARPDDASEPRGGSQSHDGASTAPPRFAASDCC